MPYVFYDKLSRLAYSDQIAEPDQLTLWRSGSE